MITSTTKATQLPSPSASDGAAALIADQLKNLDKRHVGAAMSKLISASTGDICVVMSKSPAYKFHTLADIEWLVMPAVASGQFYVAAVTAPETGFSAPVAVVTWACVSDDVDLRLAGSHEPRKRLQPNEWTSGEHLWLIDSIGDANIVMAALSDLATNKLAGKLIKVAARINAEGHQEVMSLEAVLSEAKASPT